MISRAEIELNRKPFTLLVAPLGRRRARKRRPLIPSPLRFMRGARDLLPTLYNYHITIMFMARRDSN